MPNVLTVREASREADVSNQHITRLINDGVLKAEKVGYQFLVDRASFDAWLELRNQEQARKQKKKAQAQAQEPQPEEPPA